MIFLKSNALLERPLEHGDIKDRLLGELTPTYMSEHSRLILVTQVTGEHALDLTSYTPI
jgi:hypothetical protein